MLINTKDANSMKDKAKCTFLLMIVVANHTYCFKTNQTNFLILILLTKKIIWSLYLKEKYYVIELLLICFDVKKPL